MAGIAVMYIFNAMSTVLKLWSEPEALAALYRWQVGTLGGIGWNGVEIMLVVTVIGASVGMISGYYGGRCDSILMKITSIAMAIPSLPMTIVLVAYLDASIDGRTVGFGGSATLNSMGLYELLEKHNTAIWHWKAEDVAAARKAAMLFSGFSASCRPRWA